MIPSYISKYYFQAEFEKQKFSHENQKSDRRKNGRPEQMREEVWITPDGNKESDTEESPTVVSTAHLSDNFLVSTVTLTC